MELNHYLTLLWRAVPLIIVCAILAAGGAYGVSLMLPPRYDASATVLLRQSSLDGKLSQDAVLGLQELARSYSHVLVQEALLQKVKEDLRLSASSEELSTKVAAELIPNTLLIAVRAADTDGERAASIANKVATIFVEQYREREGSRFARVRQRLTEEVARQDAEIQRLATSLEKEPDEVLRGLLEERRISRKLVADGLTQAQIGSALVIDELQLVEPATAPQAPTSPRPLLNALIAALGGASLGLFVSALVQGSGQRKVYAEAKTP
jgi:capsular polysaccharide biosynthesis protein